MDYKDLTEKSLNRKRLKVLLTPSWLSGLLAILIALIITGGTIIAFNFNITQLSKQLLSFENSPISQPALTLPGQAPSMSKNSLQNTWPLIAFWGMVGLLVYFVVEFLINSINNAQEFTKELTYVHAKRNLMIKNAMELLVIRFVSLLIWLIFIDVFLKRVIPYAITLAHSSVTSGSYVTTALNGLESFALVVFCLHVNVVFLRLAFRKPRIFTNVDYLDV